MADPSWGTAADWDAAVSEQNVHHEQPVGTDWSPADTLELGYPATDSTGGTLAGYWPCDEDSGSTFADLSPAGNDATLTGATPGASGVLGSTCGSYDGVDDYAEAVGVDCNSAAYSAACWFNFSGHGDYARVLQAGGNPVSTDGAPVDGWCIQFDGSNHNLSLEHYAGGSNSTAAAFSTGLSPNTWYYLIVRTRGGSNAGRIRVFDATGAEVAVGAGTGARGTTATQALYFMSGDAHYTAGRIDEVRVWNRAISATEEETLAAIASNAHHVTDAQTS